MKTISINLKDGKIEYSQELVIHSVIKLASSFINVVDDVPSEQSGFLIHLDHSQPITKLHLTNVTPYILLFFDNNLYFQGASYSIKSGTGPFTIETQFKNILFVKMPNKIKLKHIISLNI